MQHITKNILAVCAVVFVGLASYSIPLKIHGIDPIKETSGSLSRAVSVALTRVEDTTFNLLATVAGSTKSIKASLNGQPLNIFSLEPLSYLKIQAPVFELLPIFFGGSTKTTPIKNSLTESLNQTSAPLVSKREVKPEESIVNIFCSQKILVNGKVSNKRRTITGSGVLIHRDGTVLTNAHVGEFPLLAEKNPNVVCLARYGNPAKGALSVKVSYISPEWVKEYGKYINTEGIPQTGKSDFALLKIGLSTFGTGENPPLSPISIQKNFPDVNETIYSVSYPADILGVKGVSASLPLQKEKLSVNRYYSVGTVANDVLETSPSDAGQRGSSGGAIINSEDKLVGTITTVANSSNSAKKLIRAMTINHTDAELVRFSGTNLTQVATFGSADIEKTFNLEYRNSLTSLLNNYLNSL